MSTIVSIDHLPFNSEPFYIFTELHSLHEDEIEDIYTQPGGGVSARIVFKTHEVAKKFANDFHNWHFGRTGQKMTARLSDKPEVELLNGFTNRLSDFLRARDNQILSRTVEITGFPNNHTMSNLNQLLEPVQEENDLIVAQGLDIDPNDYFYSEPVTIIHVKSPEPGVGLVQLEKPSMALEIVLRFAGTYWKNATLNARCVPDEEIDDLLIKEPGDKDAMLFVTGTKAGATSTEVREIFKDFPIRDVNLPPGSKTFCFIFLRQPDANAVLAQFGNGFQWKGRTIRVSISNKNKKKMPAFGAVSAPPAAALPEDTTDLKLNNLPYGVADSNIRILFQGFTISKVIFKQGYAFVGIATNEVGRAIEELSGKMVGDRKISVKVAQRRK